MARKPGLTAAAKSGDRRATLEALRDELAGLIASGDTNNPAAVAKQLRDVLVDLDSLSVPEESVSDDLAKRRAKRRAAVQKRSSGGNVGGKRGG